MSVMVVFTSEFLLLRIVNRLNDLVKSFIDIDF